MGSESDLERNLGKFRGNSMKFEKCSIVSKSLFDNLRNDVD